MSGTADKIDIPVSIEQYLLALAHLRKCWAEQRVEELSWFLQSMRGELPPPPPAISRRAITIHHVFLPNRQYLLALNAVTTRLGVKLP